MIKMNWRECISRPRSGGGGEQAEAVDAPVRTVDAGDAPNELPSENKGFHGQRGEADHPLPGEP